MKWLLLIAFAAFASAQLVQDGKCPEMHAMANFDKEKMLGKWYMVKHYENDYEKDLICLTSDIKSLDGDYLFGEAHAINTTTQKKEHIPFNVTLTSDNKTAKLRSNYIWKGEHETSDHQIIDTDYDNYDIVWECDEEGDKHEIYLWIESRTMIMSSEIRDKVMDILKKHNLDITHLKDVEQEKC